MIVVDSDNRPRTVLAGTQVLRMVIPHYCQDSPAMARIIDEESADMFIDDVGESTVADVLSKERRELPVVGESATVLEMAAVMVRTRVPLAAVVDGDGVLLGAVTLDALLHRLLDR